MKELTNSISYLFVYGTLRIQFQLDLLNDVKDTIRFFDHGTIKGCLYDVGQYPAAVKSTTASIIKGDVLLIKDEKTLAVLDEYEEYLPNNKPASLFIREHVKVELNNGTCVNAWVYWYNQPTTGKQKIRDTDYLDYIKNKKTV